MDVIHSIIIPMYNAEHTIEKCVNSVIRQTIKNIEIILVDDGSTDDTFSICKQLQKRDRRIILLHQSNGGVSSARNMGLDKASGKYIYFIDSDDYVDECYIENLNTSDAELIVAAYKIENYKGECQVVKKYPQDFIETVNQELLKKYIIMGAFNYAVAKRFLRSIIFENRVYFDPVLQIAEDTDFVITYLGCVQSVEINCATDYHYINRGLGTSLSNQELTEKYIDNIESSQDCIYSKLCRLFGVEAADIVTKRLVPLYKNYIAEIIADNVINSELLIHIFNKKWFRKVLDDRDIFRDENYKFRIIIKLKSPKVLLLYFKYVKHKKID